MIQLVEGEPRSGKSYFVVNYLSKFVEYDELYNEFVLQPDVLIISNIEGLKIKHWSLAYCLDLKDGERLASADPQKVKSFFSIKNFEAIQAKTKKMHIILAIDEVHELFPSGYKDKEVYEFFAYHGHIGLDVFLMTQGIESMTRQFLPLLEFVVKATPRSKKVGRGFSYKYCDKKGKYLYSKMLPLKQLVFKAYKSFRHDEQNKPRSAVLVWMTVVFMFFACGGGLMWWAINDVFASGTDVETVVVEPSPVKVPPHIQSVIDSHKTLSRVVPTEVEPIWNTYYLDGFVEQGDIVVYMMGRNIIRHDPARFRNFDRISKTVEYTGKEIYPPTDRQGEREEG